MCVSRFEKDLRALHVIWLAEDPVRRVGMCGCAFRNRIGLAVIWP